MPQFKKKKKKKSKFNFFLEKLKSIKIKFTKTYL